MGRGIQFTHGRNLNYVKECIDHWNKKKEKRKKEKLVVLVWDFAKWCWGVVIEMTKLRACVCET